MVLCTQFAFADAPDWEDNPAGYEFTATLNGGVILKKNSFIGSCSVIKQNLKIGKNCFINANVFLQKNLKDNSKVL